MNPQLRSNLLQRRELAVATGRPQVGGGVRSSWQRESIEVIASLELGRATNPAITGGWA